MLLDILLKNISTEKNIEKYFSLFADINNSIRAHIKNVVKKWPKSTNSKTSVKDGPV